MSDVSILHVCYKNFMKTSKSNKKEEQSVNKWESRLNSGVKSKLQHVGLVFPHVESTTTGKW